MQSVNTHKQRWTQQLETVWGHQRPAQHPHWFTLFLHYLSTQRHEQISTTRRLQNDKRPQRPPDQTTYLLCMIPYVQYTNWHISLQSNGLWNNRYCYYWKGAVNNGEFTTMVNNLQLTRTCHQTQNLPLHSQLIFLMSIIQDSRWNWPPSFNVLSHPHHFHPIHFTW